MTKLCAIITAATVAVLAVVIPAQAGPEVKRTVWDRLARCETWTPRTPWGNWKHKSYPYEGGLGFHYASWDQYKPRGFPNHAYQATKKQQIIVGKRIQRRVGWGAWPACSERLGLR